MSKISAVIIVKNGEAMIADCIESVRFCDEIMVIDTGSTDRTTEIARHLGATVYLNNATDFASWRNYGLRKAKGSWILYVDVDERVSEELADNIKQVLDQRGGEYSAYWVNRKNYYFGAHPWPYIEKILRLFKKKDLIEWQGQLHESPRITGSSGNLAGELFHYTHQDLAAMVSKTIAWSSVEAKLRFEAKHPKMTWWRFPRVMLSAFYDSYVRQKGYSAGTVGLIESLYQMFSMFITYAKLWELQNKEMIEKNKVRT